MIHNHNQPGSLYDVIRKARREPAFAARLTWPRRLLMAMDAGEKFTLVWSGCEVLASARKLS
jgi:hypothetical protein